MKGGKVKAEGLGGTFGCRLTADGLVLAQREEGAHQ